MPRDQRGNTLSAREIFPELTSSKRAKPVQRRWPQRPYGVVDTVSCAELARGVLRARRLRPQKIDPARLLPHIYARHFRERHEIDHIHCARFRSRALD